MHHATDTRETVRSLWQCAQVDYLQNRTYSFVAGGVASDTVHLESILPLLSSPNPASESGGAL